MQVLSEIARCTSQESRPGCGWLTTADAYAPAWSATRERSPGWLVPGWLVPGWLVPGWLVPGWRGGYRSGQAVMADPGARILSGQEPPDSKQLQQLDHSLVRTRPTPAALTGP
jgi:hypothetical protein